MVKRDKASISKGKYIVNNRNLISNATIPTILLGDVEVAQKIKYFVKLRVSNYNCADSRMLKRKTFLVYANVKRLYSTKVGLWDKANYVQNPLFVE